MYKEIKIKNQKHFDSTIAFFDAYAKARKLELKSEFIKETKTLIIKNKKNENNKR